MRSEEEINLVLQEFIKDAEINKIHINHCSDNDYNEIRTRVIIDEAVIGFIEWLKGG